MQQTDKTEVKSKSAENRGTRLQCDVQQVGNENGCGTTSGEMLCWRGLVKRPTANTLDFFRFICFFALLMLLARLELSLTLGRLRCECPDSFMHSKVARRRKVLRSSIILLGGGIFFSFPDLFCPSGPLVPIPSPQPEKNQKSNSIRQNKAKPTQLIYICSL